MWQDRQAYRPVPCKTWFSGLSARQVGFTAPHSSLHAAVDAFPASSSGSSTEFKGLISLHRNAEKAEKAAEDIRKATGSNSVEAYHGDLSSLQQTRQLAEDVKKRHPSIDVLINNAGKANFVEHIITSCIGAAPLSKHQPKACLPQVYLPPGGR